MKKSAKLFFNAMGSILDLCPAGSYSDYRSSASDIESISSDWINVGAYMRDSVADNEQKKIRKKTTTRPPAKSC